ncbi:MAG: molybdopterin-guanine dinucleotide biosynthesis protein B [Desulfobacteraceae bacterium]|nr:molybdopterin-guanine dinucleotide biosynthesis protein B [Desulfobacteraceae bacterium]
MIKILSENITPPVVSVVGNSGAGKTTFLEKVIREMIHRGLKVGTIKHDVHGRFEMDKPGKDSWRHKHAGASTTVISSPNRIGVVMDVEYDHSLDELVSFFSGMDIILTEGYKKDQKPKLEIFRPEITQEPLCKNDENLLAFVTDAPIDFGVPVFSAEDIKGVADFLIVRFNLIPSANTDQKKTAT